MNHCHHLRGRLFASLCAGLALLTGAAELQVTPVFPLTSITPEWRERREGAGVDLLLLAPRNGTASAPVVVEGGDTALRNLNFRISDARSQGAVLPSNRFEVRFAGVENQGLDRPVHEFSVLNPDPVPPRQGMQVLWISVRVPPTQPPGLYTGIWEISAGGQSRQVPFTVEIPAFVMPDPYEMKVHASVYLSPEAIAWHYDVPMWSDAHYDLMAPSLRMAGRLGQRHLELYLYPDQYFGRTANIPFRNVNGSPRPDFSFAERYLREVMTLAGPPHAVSLILWSPTLPMLGGGRGQMPNRLPVTFVSEDGQFTAGDLPIYGPRETLPFWRATIQETRNMMDRAGMQETILTLGVGSDDRPNAETISFFREAAPDIGWYLLTHGRGDPRPQGDHMIIGDMVVTYYISPFGPFRDRNRRRPAIIGGWNNAFPQITSQRFGVLEPTRPLINFRTAAEGGTEGEWRGFTGMGLDHWVVQHPVTGRRESTMLQHGRGWPRMHTQNTRALAAPGPRGALATTRFEMLLEGIQDAEARITVERVLVDDRLRQRLPPDLAAEMEAFLQQRVDARYEIFRQEGMGSNAIWAVAENAYTEARQLFAYAARAQAVLAQAGQGSPPTRDAGLRALPPGPRRTWSDTTGRQLEARLLQRQAEAVVLLHVSGREITVPLHLLSPADRQYLEAQP